MNYETQQRIFDMAVDAGYSEATKAKLRRIGYAETPSGIWERTPERLEDMMDRLHETGPYATEKGL